MKRGRFSQRDYEYVLECRVPSPPSGLKSEIVSEEDEDEIEGGASQGVEDPSALIDELSALEDDGDSAEFGIEVIRCVRDEVVSMEVVLPGERVTPWPSVGVEVISERDGPCLVLVGDDDVEVSRTGEHRAASELDGKGFEIQRGSRATLSIGDRRLLLRTVGISREESATKLPTPLVVVGLVVVGLAIVILAVSLMQWAVEL